ncbi:FAS1 domain-containing protein [Spathaspora sp. JA1]|nr:FAS1 domain-containing protein [Spathaspora sp. JA1]
MSNTTSVVDLIVPPTPQSATTTSTNVPSPTPSTLVDILSAQPQYSYFLRHLQRQGMIPVLNSLQNVSLLAPINSAFVESKDYDIGNHELLRYIVSSKFRVGHLGKKQVLFDTLYETEEGSGNYSPISITPDFETFEYVVDEIAYIIDPDVYAKHQYSFLHGIDHLLPLKPTLCEVLMGDYEMSDSSLENMTFIQHLFQSLFIDDDEDDDEEEDFLSILRRKKKNKKRKTSKSRKKKNKKKGKKKKGAPKEPKIPESCEEFLQGFETIIIPTDDYIEQSLTKLQIRYYLANYHSLATSNFSTTEEAIIEIKRDILSLLNNLMVPGLIAGVNGTDVQVKSKSGVKLEIDLNKEGDGITLNNRAYSNHTKVVSDGVLHIFDTQKHPLFQSLNLPTVELIPRKSLYAMHFSNFVKELNFRSLDELVDGSTADSTLFINMDSRDDSSDEDSSIFMESTLAFSSKQQLLYQFASVPINLEDNTYRLFESRLCSKRKVGGCFKLKLSTSVIDGIRETTINDEVKIIDGPIEIGNGTVLYLAQGEIEPPVSLKHALGDLISDGKVHRHLQEIEVDKKSCLRTLEYLNNFDLSSLDDNGEGYSVLLPCGTSGMGTDKVQTTGVWKELGLTLNYLEANPELFKEILGGMIFQDDIYSDFGLHNKGKKSITLKDMNDHKVEIKHIERDNDDNNIIKVNNTDITIPINSDILFNQGVIHVVDRLLLPDTFSIPFEELINLTTDSNYPHHAFSDLLKVFPKIRHALGLDDGTNMTVPSSPYSLLIPSPEALKDFNITRSFDDLLNFIEFHLVPNEEVSKLLNCISGDGYDSRDNITDDHIIRTNYTDTGLTCRHKKSSNKILLQFQKLEASSNSTLQIESYNKDHEVRLLSHGCTSMYKGDNNTKNLGCVFLIDKPLNLEWLRPPKDDDTFLHIHLGFISVGVGIILGLILFGGVLIGFIFCLGGVRRKSTLLGQENQLLLPRADSGFMSVLTDDDDFHPYDRGYETDVDILRTEGDSLLPKYVKRKKIRRKDYGSISGAGNSAPPLLQQTDSSQTLPRNINKGGKSVFTRERDLPGLSQF